MSVSTLKWVLIVALMIACFERRAQAWMSSRIQNSAARPQWRSRESMFVPQIGRRGSLFAPLESAKSLSIALDRSVVPRGLFGGTLIICII